jgi:diguanylate cyclase (GGDEF)-like protein/PAS domain S-box-containing protein
VLLEVNPGFEAATGYSRAEALGRSTLDLGLWADPAEREAMVADLRRQGEVLDRGFGFRCKDGGLRAGRFSARPLTVAGEACLLFVMRDVTERQRTEAELRQRDRLVQAAADAMALLLAGGEPGESIGAALAVLGAAVDADRAYLFENSTDPVSGAILASQRYEWCAQTARPQIGNPNLQNIPYEPAVARWYRTLSAGGAIKGSVRELPASERAMLEPQDILSVLVLPIRIEDRFWGFIGFDDCRRERAWTSIEENVLRSAAAALGQTSVRLRAEAALRASEERLREIANKVPGVVFQFYARPNGDMGLYYFSERGAEIFGIEPPLEEALARFSAQVAPEDREAFLASIQQAVASALPWDFEGRYVKPDGERLWFRGSASSPVRQGQELVYAGFILDSSEQRRTEERQRLATAVFEASREAILVTDAQGGIVAVNPAFSALTGYPEAEVLGRNPRLIWAERQPAAFFAAIAHAVAHEGVWQGEFLARRKDGGRRAVLASLAAVRDTAGRTTHYVGMATDITEIKAAERRIKRLAYYDPLTELPNRALLAQRAELALALAARHGQSLAVLFLDLDRFKEVNDSLGHAEGDALLIQVAARLQALARAEDTICRLGGDEFVLLLSEADQEGAVQVADRALASFREPFELGGRALGATASIGIALYPHDGADFAELLKNADTALYRAKHEGRNTRVFYDREMNAATLARMVLESELRQAIAAGQLRAYYQPKVRLADGALVGAEALVRWAHPARGLLGPDGFVPVAEASDLIVALGDWMLCEVCRQQAAWRSGGLPLVPVAINLAARHFRHPGLAHRVQTLLEAHDLVAEALELELTESALLEAGAGTAETLAALERLGVRLGLDDFGAGYSSLSYLKRLPLDALKIDRSFVHDLESDPDDRTLTATIVALGQHLGLVVIAEGVETEEQRRILLGQGCDLAQGYLFAPPAPADTFAASWLRPGVVARQGRAARGDRPGNGIGE